MTRGLIPQLYDPRMMNPLARFALPGMARGTPFMGNQGLPMQAQPVAPQFPQARAPLVLPTGGTPETQAQPFRPVTRPPLGQAPPTGGINSLRGYAYR